MLFLQSVPHKFNCLNLLTYEDRLVIMNIFFMRAFLAIVGLGLILSTVVLFADEYHFISAARAIRHDFNHEKVSQSYLSVVRLNHISISFS